MLLDNKTHAYNEAHNL